MLSGYNWLRHGILQQPALFVFYVLEAIVRTEESIDDSDLVERDSLNLSC